MIFDIRPMTEADREKVLEMMQDFFSSPAVATDGSDEILANNFDACMAADAPLEGYVFDGKGKLMGYAMIAKTWNTEFGSPCIWTEDLYIRPDYRSMGLGGRFFAFLEEKYPKHLLRLEVEAENERAIQLYETCGFHQIPYYEMKKNQ